jgi:hypothetical protein
MRKRSDLTFLVGWVEEVDEDRYTMSVETYGGFGKLEDISVSQPFAGTNCYMAGMPQIGSVVVLANNDGNYIPLCYLPNYVHALDAKNVRVYPEGINLPQANELMYKFPKLRKGDMAFSSGDGAEIIIGERLVAKQYANELVIDGSMDHMISTSLNNFVFAAGIWRNSGIITRNLYDDTDEDSSFAVTKTVGESSHRTRLQLEPNGNRFFSEYLLEVEDIVSDYAPRNEVNSGLADNDRNPAAIFAMGNLVGNNASRDTYGQVLRVGLFNSPEDDEGQFTFETLTGEDALRYGMAVSLFAPNRRNPEKGGFIGIDKEGHIYQYAPSATCGGIGKGRSISVVALGSKKEIFGKESKYGNSWDMSTSGGIRWVVGKHNERNGNPYSNRSIDIRTRSSVFYMYGGDDPKVYDFEDSSKEVEDLRKYGKIEKVDGKERNEVDGGRETIIRSSDKLQIEGMRQESIAGAYTVNVGQDMNIAVASVFSEKVTKEKQETFGSRLTVITSGDAELEIKSIIGNIKETISKVGSKSTKITAGNIEESIKVGSKKVSIITGDSNTEIKTGSHYMSTKSGNISVSTKIGTFEAKSTIKASLVASLAGSATVEGGSISLKSKEKLMGGVVTDKTHFDYITGAPLVGSKTVKAAGLPG